MTQQPVVGCPARAKVCPPCACTVEAGLPGLAFVAETRAS